MSIKTSSFGFLKILTSLIVSGILAYFFPVYDISTSEIYRTKGALILAMGLIVYGLIDEILSARYANKEIKEYYYDLLKSKRNSCFEFWKATNETENTSDPNQIHADILALEKKIAETYENGVSHGIPLLTRDEWIVSKDTH